MHLPREAQQTQPSARAGSIPTGEPGTKQLLSTYRASTYGRMPNENITFCTTADLQGGRQRLTVVYPPKGKVLWSQRVRLHQAVILTSCRSCSDCCSLAVRFWIRCFLSWASGSTAVKNRIIFSLQGCCRVILEGEGKALGSALVNIRH